MSNNKSYKKSNFGGAFFFLPKRRKEALGVIYAFCRLADDTVDENYPDARERLAALYTEIDLVFKGSPQTLLGKDLQKAVQEFNIPKKYFTDLLDGMAQDLEPKVRCQNAAEQRLYMYRVAGTVGLMCLCVFGYKNKRSEDYARTLGNAVQLTNILRDAAADAAINRIYIPLDEMQKYGVKEEDFLSLNQNPRLKALLAAQAAEAREYYKQARALLPKEDFKTLLAARAMGNIYEGILEKFIFKGCSLSGKKIKLNKLEKLLILFRTWREKQ